MDWEEEPFQLERQIVRQELILRPYQVEGVAAIRHELGKSGKTLGILATGTGKTELAAELIRTESVKGALFVTPMIQLVAQTAKRLRERGIQCGVEQGGLRSDDQVTVACYASLLSRKRWERFVGTIDLIIVDEVHTNFSKRALEMLTNLTHGGVKLVGLTASPERAKGDPLTTFYGNVGFFYPIQQATTDGWLVPAKVWLSVIESLDLSRFKTTRFGDYAPEELARVMAQEKTVQEIGSLIEQHFEWEPSVVFCQGIFQAEAMVDNLRRRGITASIVHSQMEDLERRGHLAEFESGRVKVIINVGCLTLGWDHPPVRKLFIAKPTKSKAKYIQMFGRGTRALAGVVDGILTAEGRRQAIAASQKPFFEVFDLTDSSRNNDLCSSLDALYPDLEPELLKRVRKAREGSGGALTETLDPLIAAERAAEAREQLAREKLEWHRREEMIAHAAVGNYQRDMYAESEAPPKFKRWHMLFGKHKGKPLKDVPTPYLNWVATESNCRNKLFIQAVIREMASRY